jgi:N,N'-diacetyllegionaminate synthase
MFSLPKNRAFIIAEAGKNFIQTADERSVEEYLENAKALALAAKTAGADAIKFQTHTVEDEQLDIHVVSPHFKGSDRYAWVTRNTRATPRDQFWKPLKAYCDEIGILFFSTPMSRGAAQLLQSLNVQLWKVGSGDMLDFVLLDYLAATKKPIIISSGMSTLEELDRMVAFLHKHHAQFTLLHCVSKYPCPAEELNLASIAFLKERYTIPIGFSDHSLDDKSAVAAVALGATVIERHFSLSREFWGSDHKVSMTPAEFARMVEDIRAQECAVTPLVDPTPYLGEQGKLLQDGESAFRSYFRKSLMAATDLPAGHVLTKHDVYAMRPQAFAGGMPSEEYEQVLGKKLAHAVKRYEPITTTLLN